jgi:hypothetical protein
MNLQFGHMLKRIPVIVSAARSSECELYLNQIVHGAFYCRSSAPQGLRNCRAAVVTASWQVSTHRGLDVAQLAVIKSI